MTTSKSTPNKTSSTITTLINQPVALEHLDDLLHYSNAEGYRKTLLEIYHLFLIHESKSLLNNFEEHAGRMYFLLYFLEQVAASQQPATGEED